jgi:hypothetical protein
VTATAQAAPVGRLLRRIRESVIGDDHELPGPWGPRHPPGPDPGGLAAGALQYYVGSCVPAGGPT